MKIKLLFAALLLGSAVHAQTTPTTTSPAPVTPPATVPQPTTPAGTAPQIPPPIGTIDTRSMPTTQQPRQDRVRNRQTVMDGQPSPSVQTKEERRGARTNAKKPRPARTSEVTDPQ